MCVCINWEVPTKRILPSKVILLVTTNNWSVTANFTPVSTLSFLALNLFVVCSKSWSITTERDLSGKPLVHVLLLELEVVISILCKPNSVFASILEDVISDINGSWGCLTMSAISAASVPTGW